jgi:hypothetical protein
MPTEPDATDNRPGRVLHARIGLASLVLMTVLGVFVALTKDPNPPFVPPPGSTCDLDLFRRVVDHVRAGEPFHDATHRELYLPWAIRPAANSTTGPRSTPGRSRLCRVRCGARLALRGGAARGRPGVFRPARKRPAPAGRGGERVPGRGDGLVLRREDLSLHRAVGRDVHCSVARVAAPGVGRRGSGRGPGRDLRARAGRAVRRRLPGARVRERQAPRGGRVGARAGGLRGVHGLARAGGPRPADPLRPGDREVLGAVRGSEVPPQRRRRPTSS